jgi:hydrogenase expression/formation protein HypC
MCLGVPGRIVETSMEDDVPMAKVDFGGVMKRACLAHVPDAQVGDYVLVHVGFALTRLDASEAQRTFDLLRELDMLDEVGS